MRPTRTDRSAPLETSPVYFCLDLDAFFAAVELLDDPALAGAPLAVGSPDPHRGVISTAAYSARRFGVRSGMATAEALRRCPRLVIRSPRFGRYAEVSAAVMARLRAFGADLEIRSIDEALFEATALLNETRGPQGLAVDIRADLRRETGLAASIGIGANRMIAKIASERAKPDGIYQVEPGTERAFLAPLPVRAIPGIGPKSEEILRRYGIDTAADLAEADPDLLRLWLGPRAGWMREAAQGIEAETPSTAARATTNPHGQSMSAEGTLGEDSRDPAELGYLVDEQAEELARRLGAEGLFARGVGIKLKDAGFSVLTRQSVLEDPTQEAAVIAAAARALLEAELLRSASHGTRYRLVGTSVSGFVDSAQLRLFP